MFSIGHITWINVVLGGWIALAPLVWRGFHLGTSALNTSTLQLWHDGALGLAIASLALLNSHWSNAINLVLGLWFIVAAFVFGYQGASLWNAIITGAAVAVVSYWVMRVRNAKQ